VSSTPEPSRRPAGTSHWAVLLAGPVVATTYFFIVYLFAEASCADEWVLVGPSTLRVVVLAATAAAAAVLVTYAWRARALWRADDATTDASADERDRRDNRRFMLVVGALLLSMFLAFTVFLAAPAVGGSLC